MVFDQYDEKAQAIMGRFEWFLKFLQLEFGVSFKDPPHDMARRFLNEIEEFNPIEE